MKTEIKKMWIKALRSGKYQQAKEQLKKAGKYCCLGVLCDLHSKATGGKWNRNSYGESKFGGLEGAVLPINVQKWAGLRSCDPTCKGHKLSVWNDDRGAGFRKISELIKRHL